MAETLQSYWSEKYRPKDLDSMILSDKDKSVVRGFLNKEEIPHLLFIGKPGTGKSTLARILTYALTKTEEDRMLINASDNRGIDIIRNKIIPFMSIPPYKSLIKIIMLDEADFLTPEAFAALRSAIEDPEINAKLKTRFILTANYANKIPDAIKSRMSIISYNEPDISQVIDRCKEILDFEEVVYDETILEQIVNSTYPDLRSTLGTLQMSVVNKSLVLNYAPTQIEQIRNLIRSIVESNDFQTAIKSRSELIDAYSASYSALEILQWILDEYVEDPLTHALAFKYSAMANNAVDDKHLILALMSDLILCKFSM